MLKVTAGRSSPSSPSSSPSSPSSSPSSPQRANSAAPPPTQPMPVPRGAPANIDAPHSFVISLADSPPASPESRAAPLPLPGQADRLVSAPRTQVLAQNQALEWSNNVGNDAELLAIAKAMGTAPGQGRRILLVAAAIVAVAVVVGGVAFGGELTAMVGRAVSGREQTLGEIVVKIRPSPDDIVLDGKSRGGGNKKFKNIDVDVPHRLVVTPRGMDPIVQELMRADFKVADDGGLAFTMDKDFASPPSPPSPPP